MEPGNINRLLLIEKVLVLKSLNLFKDTPENILADLAPLMKEMQYEQGKEIFGELSLLDADTRSASATADTDCILYKIDQEPFYELMDERPEVAKGFIKILCQRLRTMNEKSRQQ